MLVDGKNIKSEESLTKEKMSTVKILFFALNFFLYISHDIRLFFSSLMFLY